MTTTYSAGGASDKDDIRFLIGDTDSTDWQLQDEEINRVRTQSTSNGEAAVKLARALAARYSRLVTTTLNDGLKVEYSDKAQHYHDLAKVLAEQAGGIVAAIPYVGGISEAEEDIDVADTDLVQPTFKKGMHDHRKSSTSIPIPPYPS